MRRLHRSSRDKKLFGVCGGIAENVGVDANLLRILLVIVAVFSGGAVILVYLIAGFIIPRDPYDTGYGRGGPWDGHHAQPPFGGHSWQGQSSHGWHGSSASSNHGSPAGWPGAGAPHGAQPQPTPHAYQAPQPAASRPAQGIDAMMEDVEKKALRREIEELKAKISKIENQSRGE